MTQKMETTDLDLGPLCESVNYLLRRATRRARITSLPALSGVDLSPLEHSILCLIHKNPGCSLRDLAKSAYIEPPAMNRLINRLESRQLVVREKSEVDGRYIQVYLTNDGKDLLERSVPDLCTAESRVLDGLTADQKIELIRTLRRICQIDQTG